MLERRAALWAQLRLDACLRKGFAYCNAGRAICESTTTSENFSIALGLANSRQAFSSTGNRTRMALMGTLHGTAYREVAPLLTEHARSMLRNERKAPTGGAPSMRGAPSEVRVSSELRNAISDRSVSLISC